MLNKSLTNKNNNNNMEVGNMNKQSTKQLINNVEEATFRSDERQLYKGTPTNIMIGGQKFLVSAPVEGQTNRCNPDIEGKWYAHKFVTKLPEEIRLYWAGKGYKSVLAIANAKQELQGFGFVEALHKSLWQVLFNRPAGISLYVGKLNKAASAVIKYALRNGIQVEIIDAFTGYTYNLSPVYNQSKTPLYQSFDVTETQYQILTKKRAEVESTMWKDLEDVLAEYKKDYYLLNLDATYERIKYAQGFQFDDVILGKLYQEALETNVNPIMYAKEQQAVRTLQTKQVFDDILNAVAMWAPAFGISVRTKDSDSSYYLNRPVYKTTYKYMSKQQIVDSGKYTKGNTNSVNVTKAVDEYVGYKAKQEYAGTDFKAEQYGTEYKPMYRDTKAYLNKLEDVLNMIDLYTLAVDSTVDFIVADDCTVRTIDAGFKRDKLVASFSELVVKYIESENYVVPVNNDRTEWDLDISEFNSFRTKREALVRVANEVNRADVLQAYYQISAYFDLADANGISISEFFTSDYVLCPSCGSPIRFDKLINTKGHSAECMYCGFELDTEKYTDAQDKVRTRKLKEQGIVLPVAAAEPTAEELLRSYDWVNEGIPTGFVLDFDRETEEWVLVQA